MRSRQKLLALITVLALVMAACGGDEATDTTAAPSSGDTSAPAADRPSWCGPDEIKLGFTDGFGGNSWRLVTTAAGEDEAAKCPSVVEFVYADGQGDTQKAISDIQGMVATGVDALVVFPDASEAILPALRSAYEAGVVTVPYRVFPGGEDGVDYTRYIGLNSADDGVTWANWIKEILPDGGNVLMLSGPAGNSQGTLESEGLHNTLEPEGKYTFIGEQPFEVTNWDPALTQQVLTAAIAKFPEIDVIVSDFGPSLVGALPEFEKSGRSIPAIATSDGNLLGCFWHDNQENNPDFKLMTIQTGNDHVRLAMQWAIALATGGETPSATAHSHLVFENSVTGDPNAVQCEPDLPGDIYLSAEMSGADQAALMQ
ncbi:MAG: substrate-binding domain-containing protein [Acidimicrobiia bacterium]|nr:substrate-binding domain-containing protein [Acidimicrobiia bacterium]NNC41659.1 substrate-binding domain-containing protein [Acidimicrobiia bacterium]NND12516.1 substrate-binding domain-containing protein [Acidimicrobiia bacterium]